MVTIGAPDSHPEAPATSVRPITERAGRPAGAPPGAPPLGSMTPLRGSTHGDPGRHGCDVASPGRKLTVRGSVADTPRGRNPARPLPPPSLAAGGLGPHGPGPPAPEARPPYPVATPVV